jgi:hypothetical protein
MNYHQNMDTNDGYLQYQNDHKSYIPVIDANTHNINRKKENMNKDTSRSSPEIIFFLGAGASVPAGASAIVELVDDFLKWLKRKRKQDYLKLTERIIEILLTYMTEIDIERLLEITERLENVDKDGILHFYDNCIPLLQENPGYHLISNANKPNSDGGRQPESLSDIIKRFIKTTFTEKKLDVRYLEPLNQFIKSYRPIHIFSTNYDICIETFCQEYDKKYTDGFSPGWDVDNFEKKDVDVLLYKLHGSIRWYRTGSGDYEASRLILDGTKVKLDTRQRAIPLILYPGRKLEYIEPTLDMLVELKRKLDHAKYVIVIGYSFKDDHLAKMFRYAAKRNPELNVFLIGPHAHSIYDEVLRQIDIDFQHEDDDEDLDGALKKENYLDSIRKAGFNNISVLQETSYLKDNTDGRRITSVIISVRCKSGCC